MELDPLSYTEVKVDWRTSEETTWDQCKATNRDPLMLYEILCMRISITATKNMLLHLSVFLFLTLDFNMI